MYSFEYRLLYVAYRYVLCYLFCCIECTTWYSSVLLVCNWCLRSCYGWFDLCCVVVYWMLVLLRVLNCSLWCWLMLFGWLFGFALLIVCICLVLAIGCWLCLFVGCYYRIIIFNSVAVVFTCCVVFVCDIRLFGLLRWDVCYVICLLLWFEWCFRFMMVCCFDWCFAVASICLALIVLLDGAGYAIVLVSC